MRFFSAWVNGLSPAATSPSSLAFFTQLYNIDSPIPTRWATCPMVRPES